MNNEQLAKIYERIGEFFANQHEMMCIIAYTTQESEIMTKCGLQCIGKAMHEGWVVELFKIKVQTPKYVYETIPEIKPMPFTKPSPWFDSPIYFPPNTRGNDWRTGPTIDC